MDVGGSSPSGPTTRTPFWIQRGVFWFSVVLGRVFRVVLRFWGARTASLHVFIGASGWSHGLNECPVQRWRAARLGWLHLGWVQNRREMRGVERLGETSKGTVHVLQGGVIGRR